MLKRIFSVFFAFLLSLILILPSFSVSAYEVNGFEITAKSGMLASLDTAKCFTVKMRLKRFILRLLPIL